MNTRFTSYLLFVLLLFAGCSDHDEWQGDCGGGISQIEISSDISQVYHTRVNDSGFTDGDAIGVYVVDYLEGQPQGLLSHGNHATNVKFTLNNNSWTSTAKLYWTDKDTRVDAYSYYPYIDKIDDVETYHFAVQHRQDKEGTDEELAGYEASDFLWAKAEGVQPLNRIYLTHQHIMSSLQLTLVEGEGFGAGEWTNAEKAVTFTSTRLEATINLQEGKATVDDSSDKMSIIPYKKGNDWRCIVVPQTIEAGQDLIQISMEGELYAFNRPEATTYQAGKLSKFTIKVDKREKGDYAFTLISESIVAWENDAVSHNADARLYVTVDVPVAGGLEKAISNAGLNCDNILNLKITGQLTDSDFNFMIKKLKRVEAINLKDVRTVNCTINDRKENDVLPDYAFCDKYYGNVGYEENECRMTTLKYIVFPEKMTKIGKLAFRATSLTQTLDFPEGLTYIGNSAFDNSGKNNVFGGSSGGIWYSIFITKVNFPSTLKYIGDRAFAGCYIDQELVLPEEIEYIGEWAFEGCSNLYGMLHLPQGLTTIRGGTFYGLKNLKGTLEISSSVTSIENEAFAQTGFTRLYLNEGLKSIGYSAFAGSGNLPFSGDLIIPSTVLQINEYAFAHTGFNHVYLPNNFEEIGEGWFYGCTELIDTITIPSKVNHIGNEAFIGCEKLGAIILPEKLLSIGERCFENCYNLDYIECKSKTPPTLYGDGHFDGMAKDNFTLVVPKGCVDAYRNAPGWNEFKRISEYRNFVCRPQTARLLNKGNERKIVLNADGSWKVTHLPSWAHISKSEGVQKTELTVTIDALTRGAGNRKDSIVFALNGTDHTTYYKIEQFDSEYDEDASMTLQKASRGKGINLVFLGDGYDAKDICDGIYLNDMKQSVEYFFDVEPYKAYREYFNVYTVFAMSYDSRIGTVNTLRNAKFGTFVGDCKTRMKCDFDKALFYAIDNTSATESMMDELTCVVVANTPAYDGVTAMYPGSYGNGAAVALCPKSESDYPYDARGMIQHEAGGHAFGKFADEYIYHAAWIQTCGCPCCEHVEGLQAMHNFGWGLNMSLTGKYKEVPWAHLINDNRYNDIVDIYEGGYFHNRGAFRSEQNSCMNNNVPYYSSWSRELIVQRIKKLAGETFSYEDFVAHDSREWGQDFTRLTRSPRDYEVKTSAPIHGRAPIIINSKPIRPKK